VRVKLAGWSEQLSVAEKLATLVAGLVVTPGGRETSARVIDATNTVKNASVAPRGVRKLKVYMCCFLSF